MDVSVVGVISDNSHHLEQSLSATISQLTTLSRAHLATSIVTHHKMEEIVHFHTIL